MTDAVFTLPRSSRFENSVIGETTTRIRTCTAIAIARTASRARAARSASLVLLPMFIALVLPVGGARADVAGGLSDFRQGRFAEAFLEWRRAADSGDARGALYVGVLYDAGLGVGQDYAQALAWYRRAAEAGNATGMFNVGVMYDAGKGVPPDPRQAAAWYARAAANNFGRAEYNLALLYEGGIGVRRNRTRAIQFYIKAARDGISAARDHLARLGYTDAVTFRPAEDTAVHELQEAEQILLSRGPAAATQAAELFRRAAVGGNPLAAYDLGYCYEHALGVPRDPAQADAWYRRAAMDSSDELLRSIATAGYRHIESQAGHSQGLDTGSTR